MQTYQATACLLQLLFVLFYYPRFHSQCPFLKSTTKEKIKWNIMSRHIRYCYNIKVERDVQYVMEHADVAAERAFGSPPTEKKGLIIDYDDV